MDRTSSDKVGELNTLNIPNIAFVNLKISVKSPVNAYLTKSENSMVPYHGQGPLHDGEATVSVDPSDEYVRIINAAIRTHPRRGLFYPFGTWCDS